MEAIRAREVIASYGESGGCLCPYCNARNYPRDETDICQICGNEYLAPLNYSHRMYMRDKIQYDIKYDKQQDYLRRIRHGKVSPYTD